MGPPKSCKRECLISLKNDFYNEIKDCGINKIILIYSICQVRVHQI